MGYLSTGATAPPTRISASDYSLMAVRQRGEAGRRYGYTSVNMPGRSDIQYPNMKGHFVAPLLDYWTATQSKVLYESSGKPQDSTLNAMTLLARNSLVWKKQAAALGSGYLPTDLAVTIWKAVDDVAVRLSGLGMIPSDWALFGEAVVEAIKELPDRIKDVAKWSGLDDLLKWGFYGALAIGGLMIVTRMPPPRQNPRRRRRR